MRCRVQRSWLVPTPQYDVIHSVLPRPRGRGSLPFARDREAIRAFLQDLCVDPASTEVTILGSSAVAAGRAVAMGLGVAKGVPPGRTTARPSPGSHATMPMAASSRCPPENPLASGYACLVWNPVLEWLGEDEHRRVEKRWSETPRRNVTACAALDARQSATRPGHRRQSCAAGKAWLHGVRSTRNRHT